MIRKVSLYCCFFFSACFCVPSVGAVELQEHSYETAHTIRMLEMVPFFKTGEKALVAWGPTKEGARMFSFYPIEGLIPQEKPKLTVTLPDTALFFDFAAIDEKGRQSLLAFDADGVLRYDRKAGAFVRLLKTSSIYRQNGTPLFEKVDIARDMTGDGLDDILVPDFDGYHLFVAKGDGHFEPGVLLHMPVEMRMQRASERYDDFPPFRATPRYSQFPYFVADANFDGLSDILFLKDQSFLVFHQKKGGSFETESVSYPFPIKVVGNSFAQQLDSVDRYSDQRNLAETVIREVKDMNGDGTVDIVTVTDRAEGLFNRSTVYGFYYGYEMDGKLAYHEKPDSHIDLKGYGSGTTFVDFTKDGRLDFATGAVDIGIGKIISILLSGSAGIHVHFFQQREDGTFAAKADYRKKISVKIDLSSGQSTIPVVELADLNCDGAKDLIVSKKQEKFEVQAATQGGRSMFDRKKQEFAVALPKKNDYVRAADVNGDCKSDLLVHYDPLGADGPKSVNRFKVLIAQ